MSKEWYVQRNGQVLGPFSSEELRKQAEKRQLLPTDGIRKGTQGDWILAAKAKKLFANPVPSVVPVPQTQVAPQQPVSQLIQPQPERKGCFDSILSCFFTFVLLIVLAALLIFLAAIALETLEYRDDFFRAVEEKTGWTMPEKLKADPNDKKDAEETKEPTEIIEPVETEHSTEPAIAPPPLDTSSPHGISVDDVLPSSDQAEEDNPFTSTSSTQPRTWTAKSGHKTKGDFVSLENDAVHISMTNGKTIQIKLNLLSEADQEFAKTQQREKEEQFVEVPKETPSAPTPVRNEVSQPATPTVERKTETRPQSNNDTGTVEVREKLLSVPDSSRNGKNPQMVTLTVEGIGTTFEDAKKDAFRNAISEVVGTLVDAETRVTQEKVLEELLTASNAYVDKHKILSRKQNAGLWEVKMEATVERRAIQMRLLPTREAVRTVDGASIAGSITTKATSENESILLLAKVLKDHNYPYSIIDVAADMEKNPLKKEGDKLTMQVNVVATPNVAKFDEFRESLEPVLEKIAISKRTAQLKSNDKFYVTNPPLDEIVDRSTRQLKKTIFLHVNSSRNASFTNTRWNSYELPLRAIVLLSAYNYVVPAIDISLNSENEIISSERIPCATRVWDGGNTYYFHNCIIQLMGANKKMRGGNSQSSDIDINMGSIVDHSDYFYSKACFFCPAGRTNAILAQHYFIAPAFGIDRFILPHVRMKAEFTIDVAELEAMKSIKCNIDPTNPSMEKIYRALPEKLDKWHPVYADFGR